MRDGSWFMVSFDAVMQCRSDGLLSNSVYFNLIFGIRYSIFDIQYSNIVFGIQYSIFGTNDEGRRMKLK